MFGFLQLPWWGYLIFTLVLTQISILSVTIYLHRYSAHRSLELHPIASHFFRFWLWLTTGQVTKEWTAIHRKHHAKVETVDDPHSPKTKGLKTVLFEGAELYGKEKRNQITLEKYGQGTPDDWIERNVYSKYSKTGITLMLGIDIALFGVIGIIIWAIQMSWVPFFGGVINGIGHHLGYRNFECADASRNISPLGIFIGGEELHNNHHTYGTSAQFSVKWWEIDLGWSVIRLLQLFGLAKPKRIPPKAAQMPGKTSLDVNTVKAIFAHRYEVIAHYSKTVIIPLLQKERCRGRARRLLTRDTSLVNQDKLAAVLEQHPVLEKVYAYRLKLQNLWAQNTASQHTLLETLQEWCAGAEASGISLLKEFAAHLKTYVIYKPYSPFS